jgi:hypothetical protein
MVVICLYITLTSCSRSPEISLIEEPQVEASVYKTVPPTVEEILRIREDGDYIIAEVWRKIDNGIHLIRQKEFFNSLEAAQMFAIHKHGGEVYLLYSIRSHSDWGYFRSIYLFTMVTDEFLNITTLRLVWNEVTPDPDTDGFLFNYQRRFYVNDLPQTEDEFKETLYRFGIKMEILRHEHIFPSGHISVWYTTYMHHPVLFPRNNYGNYAEGYILSPGQANPYSENYSNDTHNHDYCCFDLPCYNHEITDKPLASERTLSELKQIVRNVVEYIHANDNCFDTVSSSINFKLSRTWYADNVHNASEGWTVFDEIINLKRFNSEQSIELYFIHDEIEVFYHTNYGSLLVATFYKWYVLGEQTSGYVRLYAYFVKHELLYYLVAVFLGA